MGGSTIIKVNVVTELEFQNSCRFGYPFQIKISSDATLGELKEACLEKNPAIKVNP